MRVFSRDASAGRKVFEAFLAVLIIAFLAAILWPVQLGGHGDKNNRQVHCLSQTKQLVTGTLIYTSDNDDHFPPYYTFDGKDTEFKAATFPYTKNPDIYRCPGLKGDRELASKVMLYSHCLSLKGQITEFDKGKRMLEVSYKDDKAAKIPFLRDIIVNPEDANDLHSPHGENFSVVYLDGHAKIVKEIDKSGAL